MRSGADLEATLRRIDRRGYRAYKDIAGAYELEPGLELHIDHVQADPFASPSKMRLRVAQAQSQLPPALCASPVRRIALEDFLGRQMRLALDRHGQVSIDAGAQEVLERTAVRVAPGRFVEARLQVGLPAAGRKVLGREAAALLLSELPGAARRGLCWSALSDSEGQAFVECVENQEAIRAILDDANLVAFVADGAILPRASGADDRPLQEGAVPFSAPPSLRVSLELPNLARMPGRAPSRTLTGMGVPRGITLIVGGGYHGKSTLLRALERGVYPHVPGDGREYVVTAPDAVKIRAEDGRRVERVDIHPFVSNLPHGRDTRAFSSDDASGSTSQAANIVEALELGATALLLDEDTSATNFMVRDARMQALVSKAQEPITPFVDRVREVYEILGVSSILVMGGSGDYFDVADIVVLMDSYHPHDVTGEAARVAAAHPTRRQRETATPLQAILPRIPQPESFDPSRGRRAVKIDARGLETIGFGATQIDLRQVEQLVDPSQLRAIGCCIHLACQRFIDGQRCIDGQRTLRAVVDAIDRLLDEVGLGVLDPHDRDGERHPGNFARPRRFEVAGAINRLRTVAMRPPGGEPTRS